MIIKELLTHGAVSGDRHSSALSQSENIVALVGLGVCDGAHRLVVMKKGRGRIAGVKIGRGISRLEKDRDVEYPACLLPNLPPLSFSLTIWPSAARIHVSMCRLGIKTTSGSAPDI